MLGVFLLLGLNHCGSKPRALPSLIATPSSFSPVFTLTGETPSTITPFVSPQQSTSTQFSSDSWETLPIIPVGISDRTRDIYHQGLAIGNSPTIFTRVGDCSSAAPAFLTDFASDYNLGAYSYLQPAVDYFHDSFSRPSFAAKAGLNTAGVLSTVWTDEQCLSGESLLECQYRLDQPAFAFISLGTNDVYYFVRDAGSFERNMRQIIEQTTALGIIPILATKADNLEGGHAINATIARLALEYQLPLWNFWLAVKDLPEGGLLETEHLTTISHLQYADFSRPHALEYGMQMRNLTALQVLYFLWQQLSGESLPSP